MTPSLSIVLLALLASSFAEKSRFFSLKDSSAQAKEDPCSNKKLESVSCVPDFVNAAFGIKIKPVSVCQNCLKNDLECNPDHCNGQEKVHDKYASFLTDLHNPNNETCWRGEFLNSENVSLTLSLKKKFELTYISLHFCGEKPDSMAIYKSMDHGITWQSFQYYSNDCQKIFNQKRFVSITRANEQEALCADTADIREGSRIAFSTLADRPSAENFEHSPVLQDWVTATDIRIVFPRKNDDNNSSLRTIGVSDLAVGGRCKCNGHASECIIDNATGESICNCKHNTAGKECEKCKGKFLKIISLVFC